MRIKWFSITAHKASITKEYKKGIRKVSFAVDLNKHCVVDDEYLRKIYRYDIKLHMWYWIINIYIPVGRSTKTREQFIYPIGGA